MKLEAWLSGTSGTVQDDLELTLSMAEVLPKTKEAGVACAVLYPG